MAIDVGLAWRFIHRGYYYATVSDPGRPFDDEYVVRTRPLNDGWMAIANGHILATGLSLRGAKQACEEYASSE